MDQPPIDIEADFNRPKPELPENIETFAARRYSREGKRWRCDGRYRDCNRASWR